MSNDILRYYELVTDGEDGEDGEDDENDVGEGEAEGIQRAESDLSVN